MDYAFPVIRHIDEIRPAIKDRNEFIIAEREWGHVINYMVNMTDTFDKYDEYYAFRRECRGLKFDREGNLLARPYHKFFNVGEKEETQLHELDLSSSHVILEKLDGSMVHPIWVDKEAEHWRLCTKMGITDVSMQAEEWLARNSGYKAFILHCLKSDVTPIFEWCSRQNRIVIDYPKERLVLTAVRINRDGVYLSMSALNLFGRDYNLDVVKSIPNTFYTIDHLVETTRELKGEEGFIVRFDNGHMFKIKADEYVKIHKAKDNILFEKNVISLILDEKLDDVVSFLPEEDAKRLTDFADQFWSGLNQTLGVHRNFHRTFYDLTKGDRKTFAIEYAQGMNMPDHIKSYNFARWGKTEWSNEDDLEFFKDKIRKRLGTQSGVDEVRHLWGGVKYNVRGDNNE
jgi:RNA ligase